MVCEGKKEILKLSARFDEFVASVSAGQQRGERE